MIFQTDETQLLCMANGSKLDFTCELLFGYGRIVSGAFFLPKNVVKFDKISELRQSLFNLTETYIANNSLSASLTDNLRALVANADYHLLPDEVLNGLGDDKACIAEFEEIQTGNDYSIVSSQLSSDEYRLILFCEFQAYQDDTEILFENVIVS